MYGPGTGDPTFALDKRVLRPLRVLASSSQKGSEAHRAARAGGRRARPANRTQVTRLKGRRALLDAA
jgi:hypothetical protein